MSDIELVLDKIGSQRIEQRRVNGGIGAANVVHGIDNAAIEKIAPETVDQTAREERVFRGSQPVGVSFPAILVCCQYQLFPTQKLRRLRLAGPGMHGRRGLEIELQYFGIRRTQKVRIGPHVDLAEKRGQPVVIGLRPIFQRVGVTAGTQHPDSAENLCHALYRIVEILRHGKINRSRVICDAAFGGQDLSGKLVDRSIRRHCTANEFAELVDRW